MATLRILSAGAAQAVAERVIQALASRCEVKADFGAVGAMKAKATAGEPFDVIILTSALIDELISAGLVQAGSKADLGRVGTGVAVRARMPIPEVDNAAALERTLRNATKIVCPDPAIATAGKIVMAMLEKLKLTDQVRSRLQFFPNGYAAMKWLSASEEASDIGITQITEILPNGGVRYAGALPETFQMKATYSAALASRTAEPDLARQFIEGLTGPAARQMLTEAGYELNV
jgi:molybdate transport system substrate-binding protein